VHTALETGGKIKIEQDSPNDDVRRKANDAQIMGSLRRRRRIRRERDEEKNTF